MAATYKSVVLARQLAEALKLRTGLAVTEGRDASQNPTVLVGSGASLSQSAFIRIKQDYDPSLFENGIGLTQRVYSPHVVQVVIENGGAVTGTGDSLVLSVANWAKILWEVSQIGAKIEIYEATTGTVDVNDITGVPTVVIDNMFQPLTSTI